MRNIAHDLREFLLGDEAITTITREVHRNDVTPLTPRPFIRILRQRANDDLTRDGAGLLTESIFGVDCVGRTQNEADELSDLVKNRLQSDPPTMGQSTIRGVFVRDKSDDYQPFPEASDEVIPFASMDADIWHV